MTSNRNADQCTKTMAIGMLISDHALTTIRAYTIRA